MAKDSDKTASAQKAEKTGGVLSGLLAEENEFDRRTLWRIGWWGAAAVAAVMMAVFANQAALGWRRDRMSASDLSRQAQLMQSLARETQGETRQLASAVETLNNDRDRLYARVTVLEQGLESVTGALAQQNSAQVPSGSGSVGKVTSMTPQAGMVAWPMPTPSSSPSAAAASPQPSSALASGSGSAAPGAATASQASAIPALPSGSAATPAPPPLSPVTTTAAAVTDRSRADAARPSPTPAAASRGEDDAQAQAQPPASAAASSPPASSAAPGQIASNAPAAGSLVAPRSIMAPPDAAATRLTGPDKLAKAEAAPEPVVASPKAGDAAEAAATPVQRTEFAVDLGGANSLGGLRALWRGLSKTHPELAKLRPIVILKEGNTGLGMQLRLGAGPLNDAAAAATICARLAESRHACETTVYDGQQLAIRRNEAETPEAARESAKEAAKEAAATKEAAREAARQPASAVTQPSAMQQPSPPLKPQLQRRRVFQQRHSTREEPPAPPAPPPPPPEPSTLSSLFHRQ